MATPVLYPLNDLAFEVKIKVVDNDSESETFGKRIPLTSGSVIAFIATSNDPTETAADPSLQVDAVHIDNGRWLVHFDGAALTATLLDSLFGSVTPYLIVQGDGFGDFRSYVELAYAAARPATTP